MSKFLKFGEKIKSNVRVFGGALNPKCYPSDSALNTRKRPSLIKHGNFLSSTPSSP